MVESDKSPNFAGEGMVGAKVSTPAIPLSWQIQGLKAVVELEIVTEFLSGQGGADEGVQDHQEPTTESPPPVMQQWVRRWCM